MPVTFELHQIQVRINVGGDRYRIVTTNLLVETDVRWEQISVYHELFGEI